MKKFVLLAIIIFMSASSVFAQGQHIDNGKSKYTFSMTLGSAFVGDNISVQIGYSHRGVFDIGYRANAVRWSSNYENNAVTSTAVFNLHPNIKRITPIKFSLLSTYTFDPASDIATIEPTLHVDKLIKGMDYLNFHFGIGYINYIDIVQLNKTYRNIGFALIGDKGKKRFGYLDFSFTSYNGGSKYILSFGLYL